MLDNGQHILLGAYSETLRLLRRVGIDPTAALLHLPLQMRYPAGSGGMDFVAPRLPAPLHLAVALLRAKGLARADKMALARFSTTARWMGWQLDTDCSVSELLERFDQTPRLVQLMWRPLCLAALNTPPERASAKVFLAVLRDSLGAGRAASDMLLPRLDLHALFPQRGGRLHRAARRHGALRRQGRPPSARTRHGWRVDASRPGRRRRLAARCSTRSCWRCRRRPPRRCWPACRCGAHRRSNWPRSTTSRSPPATCNTTPACASTLPFYALLDDPAAGHWGQFVFDRGQLDAGQAGLLLGGGQRLRPTPRRSTRPRWRSAIAAQLAAVFRRPGLATPGVEPGDHRKTRHLRLHARPAAPAQRHRPGRPGAGRRLHRQ